MSDQVIEITYRKPMTERERWRKKNPRKARYLDRIMSDDYVQSRIEYAVRRLKELGYSDESARDVLNHVGNLVARGE